MQNYKEIMERIRENEATARKLEERNMEIYRDRAKDDEYAKNCEQIEFFRLVDKILTDNARQSAIEYLVPIFAEIISKFKGKQYGEKTKAKISEQMKQKTGFDVWLTETIYSTEITFYDTETHFFWHTNTKLELTPRYKDGIIAQILSGNTIQEFDAKEWYLSYCADYVDDVIERAYAIKWARQTAKHAYEQAEQAFSALNALVPSSIDHLYPGTFRGYFD